MPAAWLDRWPTRDGGTKAGIAAAVFARRG